MESSSALNHKRDFNTDKLLNKLFYDDKLGIAGKAIADKVKARKAKKEEEKKKDTATTKAKFGASVNVQRGYPGKIRSAGDQGYTAVGKREPARTKFQKGGFPDLTGDGKVTKADVLKGRGVIKKKGGAVKKK